MNSETRNKMIELASQKCIMKAARRDEDVGLRIKFQIAMILSSNQITVMTIQASLDLSGLNGPLCPLQRGTLLSEKSQVLWISS